MRILHLLGIGIGIGTGIGIGSLVVAAPGAGAAAPVRCTQDWRPAASPTYLTPAGTPTDPPQPLAPPPAATFTPYHLFCDGHYITTVWRSPVHSVFESVRLAREIIAHAVYPSAHLGVNPARGITGLPSWFWAEPDAAPLLLVHGDGPELDVELRVDTVRWSLGDPASAANTATGLGARYPTPSPVAAHLRAEGLVHDHRRARAHRSLLVRGAVRRAAAVDPHGHVASRRRRDPLTPARAVVTHLQPGRRRCVARGRPAARRGPQHGSPARSRRARR